MFARLEPLLAEAGGSQAQLEIFYAVGDELEASAPVPSQRGFMRRHPRAA